MAFIPATIKRSYGGGKLYYQDGSDWKEFGEVKDFKYSISVDTSDAMAHDGCMEEIVDTAVTKSEAKLSFTTQNMDDTNFAFSSLGSDEDVVYAIGDELPDGTTAAVQTTVRKIKAGKKLLNKIPLRYVGAACEGRRRVAVDFPSVVVTPSGDKSVQTKDFMNLGFDGKILTPANGEAPYTEYLI